MICLSPWQWQIIFYLDWGELGLIAILWGLLMADTSTYRSPSINWSRLDSSKIYNSVFLFDLISNPEACVCRGNSVQSMICVYLKKEIKMIFTHFICLPSIYTVCTGQGERNTKVDLDNIWNCLHPDKYFDNIWNFLNLYNLDKTKGKPTHDSQTKNLGFLTLSLTEYLFSERSGAGTFKRKDLISSPIRHSPVQLTSIEVIFTLDQWKSTM